VVEPDTAAWEDARAFSWPVGLGKTFQIHRDDALDTDSPSSATLTFAVESPTTSKLSFGGQPMYRLKEQGPRTYYFLPLKDTLVTSDEMGMRISLTAPITKGHEWDCAFDASGNPTWHARIVDRFAYRNVEGTVYKNVVQVEYRPLDSQSITWVRFFAEGVGPVQTTCFITPTAAASVSPTSEVRTRVNLLPNSARD
jgi:hypothetical protein